MACSKFTPLLLILIFVLQLSCTRQENHEVSRSLPLAGEIVTLKAVASQTDVAQRAANAGITEAQRWDQLLNRRLPENQAWLNAPTNLKPVVYPSQVSEILMEAMAISKVTNHFFNPLIAPITSRYQKGQWISDVELPKLLEQIDPANFSLDTNKCSYTFNKVGMGIDLDAIAQGYIADKCLEAMLASGATAALADVGGEVAVFGTRTDGTPWRVGIATGTEGNISETVLLIKGALAVSSDLTNPTVIEGKTYSHIIDPRNGRPTTWSGTVAVYATNAASADAWATALFVAGPEEGLVLALSRGIAAKWWDPNGIVVAETGDFPAASQK